MAETPEMITMSMREADRLKTIQAVTDRMLGVAQAAQRMGISTRQVARLLQRYRTAVHRLESSVRYLGIEVDDALEISEQTEI
jgi:predicted DNA-binding protein (UPF0251 family)